MHMYRYTLLILSLENVYSMALGADVSCQNSLQINTVWLLWPLIVGKYPDNNLQINNCMFYYSYKHQQNVVAVLMTKISLGMNPTTTVH